MATTSTAQSSKPNGSSSRERHSSSRSELNSSPAVPRTAPSFSIASQTTPSSQLLTAEGLIAAHASAQNPALSALDAAVSERNTLSVQNTQLWKLIEKQRSGYGQLMKELERVRGERDVYRNKLQSLGENTDALLRAHRGREKREGKEAILRSTASQSHLRSSELSSSQGFDARANMNRTNSEDIASRSLHHSHSQDHVSRSRSTLREQAGSQTSLNISASGSRGSSITPSTLSSNVASTNSIPHPPYPRDVTPERTRNGDNASSPVKVSFPTAPTVDQDIASASASSATTATAAASSSATEMADPVLGHWQQGHRPSLDTAPPPTQVAVLTSATPAQFNLPHSRSPPRQPLSPVRAQNIDLVERQTLPDMQLLEPQALKLNSLSPYMNGDPNRLPALSRESRISLPEEAKRYYANLTDSPAPSPSMTTGSGFPSTSTGQSSPVKPQMPQIVEAAESVRSRSSSASAAGGRVRGTGGGDEASPFLDMEDGDSSYSGTNGTRRRSNAENSYSSAYDATEDMDSRDPETSSHAVAEDFPLPPTTSYATSVTSTTNLLVQSSQPSTPISPFPIHPGETQITFRALPLLASDLPHTKVHVVNSTIRPNDRGKELLSFVIAVYPGSGKEPWKVEKLYGDVLGLDARVRASVGKSLIKKMVSLPEGRLWRDHAPAKVDQRKSALEHYLRSLIALPVKNKDEIIAFFTSDIVREAQKPVFKAGYKEGYLTKRGKNFGGWKSRYFVLQGPSLEYYESRGGAHLGSITITGAQIGRQQRAPDRRESDEENEYRHAFLIIEAKRGPGGSSSRHVLCADSDADRDSWVEELVRYVTGTYTEDQVAVVQNGPSPIAVGSASQPPSEPPRSSTSSAVSIDSVGTPSKRIPFRPSATGNVVTDVSDGKLFPNVMARPEDTDSPTKSHASSPIDRISSDGPMSTSLPTTSPLITDDSESLVSVGLRANSELGHYPELVDPRAVYQRVGHTSSDQQRKKARRMSVNPLKTATIPERAPSPEKEPFTASTPRADSHGKPKISAPMNGTLIPAGYKFGGKDVSLEAPPQNTDRREKAKSRTFWGFGRHDKPSVPAIVPRAVFGVTLDESLEVAQIASLPAIVFRCIQYLESKEADQEEGIYRLSGSSAVIKSLKDRFNAEGDVDLLGSDEYWDPHAIAGLLKTFLRELPASILTRDLHLRFLSVVDLVDPQERIKDLSHLVASLPIANYSLLRALTAHLILIVQNAHVNKMTMRNVGIVFSPTLGIPAGVFSLMLGEFKRVFNVDGTLDEGEPSAGDQGADRASLDRRNSRRYTDTAADQLLGLSGRALQAAPTPDDGPSDGEEASVIEGSVDDTTENDSDLAESSATSSSVHLPQPSAFVDSLHPPEVNGTGMSPSGAIQSRASHLAASRGLNITVTDKASRRHSRVVGLPVSPRPSPRPSQNGSPSPAIPSPLSTPK
ncbi:RhoGAP-domain-containing protein [Laetiporus sulphureus 93-53]|uniref:RhoGAP-domain-containing protein n=1 Tax=Laetiporus sulphureus 93-53 TaxID=1314785 RepID=A0A165G674_9APHY|nr:RhoGAP-domain-containing protein [Laetiporus sulphureus 93-53]KZT09880.1 RhoGAP-domain-containing protein [Laetiporus sulphureus 93-53]